MAKTSPVYRSPANPHFFQPLLPGFEGHLVQNSSEVFSKHIKHEGRIVNLRTDASDRTWKVKMEENRLTKGWKEFVEAHDLRIGDFLVFRHEGAMLFHVTVLGPSCCEIQYVPSCSHNDEEESDNIGESSRNEKDIEETVKTSSDQFSSDQTCFSQTVTALNLSRDLVSVPSSFAKQNGLRKGRQEIVLMNEEGKSWKSEVKCMMSGQIFIVKGWTSFCTENKLEVGDSCTFKLFHNANTPVFRLYSSTKVERKRKIRSEDDHIDDKTGENRFVKLTPTPSSLELGKQHLPASFTRGNRLNPGKIILVDKNRAEWLMNLRVDKSSGLMYIISANGWKSFCAANEVGAGESLILELVRGGESPLLKIVSEMEQPPFVEEARPSASFSGGSQLIDEEDEVPHINPLPNLSLDPSLSPSMDLVIPATPPFSERFVTEAAFHRYSILSSLGFIDMRVLPFDCSPTLGAQKIITQANLLSSVTLIGTYVEQVVREFYVNLVDLEYHEGGPNSVYVRGKMYDFSPELINEVFNFPDIPHAVNDPTVLVEDLIGEAVKFVSDGSARRWKDLACKHLSPAMTVLYKICCFNWLPWLPTPNKITLKKDRVVLLHMISKLTPFNMGKLIFDQIILNAKQCCTAREKKVHFSSCTRI